MSTPPGFHDHSNDYSIRKFEFINECVRLAREYCFNFIETPHVELGTILTKGANEILKEVYIFNDKGGREIGLRFDHTVPLVRYFSNNLHIVEKPFKRFTYGHVFRGEKPQKGRFREFCQVDFDIIGIDSWASEVEILEIINKALSKFGIEFTFKLNDRRIIEYIANRFDCNNKVDFFRILDKKMKISEEEFKSQIVTLFGESKGNELLDYLNNPNLVIHEIETKRPEILTPLKEIQKNFNLATFDINIVRGLEYYEGVVFEVLTNRIVGAVASGGRYTTTLVNAESPTFTAFGGSIGVDRILSQLDLSKVIYDIFIIALRENSLYDLLAIRNQIFNLGFSCEVFLDNQIDTKNQLKYAEKKGFKAILFLRRDEISLFLTKPEKDLKFKNFEACLDYLKTNPLE